MRITRLSLQLYIAYLLLAAALVSCSDNDADTVVNNDIQTALDTGNTQGQALATQAQTELSNNSALVAIGKIGSILHAINDNELAEAIAVMPLTRNTSALLFAQRMITDHTAANAMLDAMLAAMAIAPVDNSVSMQLRQEAAQSISELQRTASVDVPRTYLQMEVQMHQEAFVLVGSFVNVSTGTSFDQFVRDTQTLLASHRDDAASRLRTLGM